MTEDEIKELATKTFDRLYPILRKESPQHWVNYYIREATRELATALNVMDNNQLAVLPESELETLRKKTQVTMGVGDGSGQLFVHGDYESIKAAQTKILALEQIIQLVRSAYNEAFSEGMRDVTSQRGGKPWMDSLAKQKLESIVNAR